MDLNFFGLSPLEILLIGLVALVVFGPDKLPQYARTAGKYVNEFRRMSQEVRTQVSRELTINMTDEDGKDIGIQQYIVQVRDEVKGAFTDVTRSVAAETAAVKSALTIDPNLLKNVTSDTITTTVVSNPDTNPETIVSKIEPSNQVTPLNLPSYFTSSDDATTPARPSRIHVLELEGSNVKATVDAGSSPVSNVQPETNSTPEVVHDGTPFSEYEKTFGSYDIVNLGADESNSTATGTSRKPRISKRGGYAGSRSRNQS